MNRSIELHNSTSELPRLMTFIEEVITEFAIPADYILRLQLVLEEVVSNVMLYAYIDNEKHTIKVEAGYDSNEIAFRVIDDGVEFDPTAAPDADITRSADDRDLGGLGIFIVRQTMDRVEYCRREGANILTLTKKINYGD